MKDYILFNKDKLIRTFIWTSTILTVSFCIWIYYNCDGSNCFTKTELSIGILMTTLVLPGLSLLLEIAKNFIEYRRTEKFFDKEPFNELLKNGFKKDYTDKDSKWFLSKLIAVGQFKDYQMTFEIEDGRLRVIAKTDYDHLDSWSDKEIEFVRQSFRHVKFEYDGDGIATSLRTNDVSKMSYSDFISYLSDFVRMLEKLKIS